MIFPWHFEEDRLLNESTSGEALGTTMRGIGPCYRDKVGRSHAIRLGDMYRESFAGRIEQIVAGETAGPHRPRLPGNSFRLDAGEIFQQYRGYAQRLRPYVGDTTAYLLDAIEGGKRILFEGAQGALLDIDHGTFPFVTSSNSSGVGVSSGSGVPGRHVTKVLGIVKAYCTRVGGGPFPTEQDNAVGQHIRDRGNEYGTVTRRPRRCGWFDVVAARYTARLSGVDGLAVMLLDVLSELPELRICTAYELDGQRIVNFPDHVEDLRRVVPVYETMPGWQAEISDVRRIADLPGGPATISIGSAPWWAGPWRWSPWGPIASKPSLPAMSTMPDAPTSSRTTAVRLPVRPARGAQRPQLTDVPAERMPRHIAVIMDGNGRWARRQGLPRIEGHRRGASVRRITEECARLGIQQLTLYCLSSENWKRPPEEIDFLMQLLEHYMIGERRRSWSRTSASASSAAARAFPENALREMDETIAMSRRELGHAALPGNQLRQPRGTGRRLSPHCGRGPVWQASARGHRRRDNCRSPLYGGHARTGPPHPHGPGDAGEQLPPLANQLRRDLGNRTMLAGFRRGPVACRHSRVCLPGSPFRRIGKVRQAARYSRCIATD